MRVSRLKISVVYNEMLLNFPPRLQVSRGLSLLNHIFQEIRVPAVASKHSASLVYHTVIHMPASALFLQQPPMSMQVNHCEQSIERSQPQLPPTISAVTIQ